MRPLRLLFLLTMLVAPAARAQVTTGLEVLLSDSLHLLRGKRVGLITNHTGLDRNGRRNIDLIFRTPGVQLVALFGPEHGLAGVVRGGDKIGFATDSATGLPVHSLYGDTRVPSAEMLRDVDVLPASQGMAVATERHRAVGRNGSTPPRGGNGQRERASGALEAGSDRIRTRLTPISTVQIES